MTTHEPKDTTHQCYQWNLSPAVVKKCAGGKKAIVKKDVSGGQEMAVI